MRAGALRSIIEVVKVTTSIDHGEVVSSTQTIKVRAFVHASGGRKTIDSNEILHTKQLEVTIRNHLKVNVSDRIKHEGDEYLIEGITPSYDKRWLKLYLQKVNK